MADVFDFVYTLVLSQGDKLSELYKKCDDELVAKGIIPAWADISDADKQAGAKFARADIIRDNYPEYVEACKDLNALQAEHREILDSEWADTDTDIEYYSLPYLPDMV